MHYLVLGGETEWETPLDTHADWLARFAAEQPVQTNEVGRRAPLARGVAATGRSRVDLLELGCSAGLLLYLDGPFTVTRRRGIDLHPVDVTTEGGARLLEAFIWPSQPERVERLRAAIDVARRDPPELIQGDYVDLVGDHVGKKTVVLTSVTTMYLPDGRYELLCEKLAGVDWVSLEWPRHDHDYEGMQLSLNGRVLEEHVDFHGAG